MSFVHYTRLLTTEDGIIPQAWRDEVVAALIERALPLIDLPDQADFLAAHRSTRLGIYRARSLFSLCLNSYKRSGWSRTLGYNQYLFDELAATLGTTRTAVQNAVTASTIRPGRESALAWNAMRLGVLYMQEPILFFRGFKQTSYLGQDAGPPPGNLSSAAASEYASHHPTTPAYVRDQSSSTQFYSEPVLSSIHEAHFLSSEADDGSNLYIGSRLGNVDSEFYLDVPSWWAAHPRPVYLSIQTSRYWYFQQQFYPPDAAWIADGGLASNYWDPFAGSVAWDLDPRPLEISVGSNSGTYYPDESVYTEFALPTLGESGPVTISFAMVAENQPPTDPTEAEPEWIRGINNFQAEMNSIQHLSDSSARGVYGDASSTFSYVEPIV